MSPSIPLVLLRRSPCRSQLAPLAARAAGARWTAAAFIAAGLWGCTAPQGPRRLEILPLYRQVLGRSLQGRPIEALTLGTGGETCLLVGVIHGDEPLGAPLLRRFVQHLRTAPRLVDGRRIVVIPVLNPDGLHLRTRTNARGVDLNRNLPARNWSRDMRHGRFPGSEPETQVLLRALATYEPSRILAVHSPLFCVNFDGPAEDLGRKMAEAAAYPLRYSVGYPTPGSLGNLAGADRSIATITLELRPYGSAREAWEELRSALRIFAGG